MHVPVLLREMLQYLSPQNGGVYVDATFGGGGYASAILDSADCKVIGIDRDPDAIARGEKLKSEKYGDRLTLIQSTFCSIDQVILEPVDGLVFDYGVSSFQLDEADRGFSFMRDGPLDMRMSKTGLTAAEVVNTYSEKDLADIIFHYGDEPFSRSIARAIVQDRVEQPYETTLQLAGLIRRVVKRKDSIDAATKTFQALRIFVNNELIEIRDALQQSLKILKSGAHLVGVTFHSLEDRLLKRFLIDNTFQILTKPLAPSRAEILENSRSRSAKLRAGIYTPQTHIGGDF
ncbi:MAG: 16S rRNA (cytosine(1402)-N(4))-methyltransferase [Alphaproteobacteria bacterium CG_4_10_14_0_8_um_filter_37_21]|nr:MAG: 16S rRNA (cytosine(1402)-N(4))-methyltransferase [Alphaproteobacteria bacterium CG_4_10_14_0_8_um_filter_37_21]